MTQTNTPVAAAEEADTSTQTALADENEALDRELGLVPEADITPDAEADESDESEESEQDDTEDSEEDAEAEESESDESEDSDDEDDDPSNDADADFKSIPEEHQEAVGKLISKARHKERAKNEAKIAELTETAGKVTELEQARDDLEGQLTELRAEKSVPAATEERPLASLTTEQDLRDYTKKARTHLRELQANPDEIQVPDGQGGQRYLTDTEVQQRIAFLQDRLTFDVPEHQSFLRDNAQAEQQLLKDYPDLGQPKSQLAREVNKVLADQPQLKAQSGYRRTALSLALGNLLIGKHGDKAYSIATGKVAPARKVAKKQAAKKAAPRAPAPPAASSAPRRAAAPAKQGQFSEDAFDQELFG